MSIFERPGSMEAATEWNAARDERMAAKRAYDEARDRLWSAKVRMAIAHKRAVELVAPEHAGIFIWLDELDGPRDEIIAAASRAGHNT